MVFKREYTQHPVKKIMHHVVTHRGVNDLLTYLIQLNENTILHKDGALSAHFSYLAPDSDSETDHTLNYISQTWKNALSFLGNGWLLETNVVCEPFNYYSGARDFPEIVSALVDDERRNQYQGKAYFKTTYYLSLTYKPESALAGKLKRFAIDNSDTVQESNFDECIHEFEKKVAEFINYLKRALNHIEPLSKDALTSFLHHCITGHLHKLKSAATGSFLDSYLSSEDFIAGFFPKIGKKYIKVLSLDDLPESSFPAILKMLQEFPVTYRWSSRFVVLDKVTAIHYLKRYERNWSSKAIGALGVIRESMGLAPKRDIDAQNTADTIKQAQLFESSGQLGHGFYNSVLILMDEDQILLSKIAEEMTTQIQQADFKVREESVNAVEAYLGSLPSHGDYNLRKMMVDTNYVSHALPISSLYQGSLISPCDKAGYKDAPALLFAATTGDRPFLLNCHVGDVGHTAILGPTGMGKSTLIGALMMGHRQYHGSRIIVLDKDYSNRLPIKALGGSYFDLSKNECALSPLARVNENNPHSIDLALDWLTTCLRVQGVLMAPERQTVLREALIRLSHEKQQYKNLAHLNVQEESVREALNTFNTGRFEKLLNGSNPAFENISVLGFEMSGFLQNKDAQNNISIAVIQAILSELEILFQDRRPTLLILEEAWIYLRHPIFQEKLMDWFKTLRKYNVAVFFVSQDLDDIVKSESASVIQSACMTRIFLPNKALSEERVKAQYQAFGLNDQQCALLREATPKQDYYYSATLGNRLFRLDLQDVAKSFLCISEKKDMDAFDKIYQSKDASWIIDWLSYQKLPHWVDFIKTHYLKEHIA